MKSSEDKVFTNISSFLIYIFFVIGLLLFFTISKLYFPIVTVSGKSMDNTLFDGEMLVAETKFKEINYGDIMIASHTNYDKGKSKMVKRVIGLEGDIIESKNNLLYRNGKLLEEDYIKEKMNNTYDMYYTGYLDTSNLLTFGENEETILTEKNQDLVNFTVTVPENHVWLMGDNRNNSSDSRYYGSFDIDKDIQSKVKILLNISHQTYKKVFLFIIIPLIVLISLFVMYTQSDKNKGTVEK